VSEYPIIAVGAVIINKHNQLLIAKRAEDKPMPNKWEFPGGKLEKGESLEACAIREIKEELQIDISIDTYVGFENIHYKDKDFCLHLYTAHMTEDKQDIILNVHTALAWVDYKELFDYDLPLNKFILMKTLKMTLEEESF